MTILVPSRTDAAADASGAAPASPAPWWPAALSPKVLSDLDLPTPFLACDLDTVADRYGALVDSLPEVSVFYAMKSNPARPILSRLHQLRCGFEIASIGELDELVALGVDPAQVLFSNPVKPPKAIARAHELGLWRFSVDGAGEIAKIARYAPGSAVYLRLRVDDAASVFPLSRKFGADGPDARALLVQARSLGLRPYGVTFHVGSQCQTTSAWRSAVGAAGSLMSVLATDGIELQMLDLGGGLPARYGAAVPGLDQIAPTITRALRELLPYRPALLAIEPGRHLVAESGVMVAEVIGVEHRGDRPWVYLDLGAYNGLMETQQAAGSWTFPLWSSRPDHAGAALVPCTVTGPSCDSSDTMFHDCLLPSTIETGDRLFIGSAGAYTSSYASRFNGFPLPGTHFVGGR